MLELHGAVTFNPVPRTLVPNPQCPAAQQGRSPAVPHQSGKTTLARQFLSPESSSYFDLEVPASLRRLEEPMLALQDLRGVVAQVSGLLHQLLGVRTKAELEGNPKSGASWEGFAFEEVLRASQPDQHYFWRTRNGAELDLLLFKGGKRVGVEFKLSDAPALTPSMLIALEDLELPKIWVIHAGTKRFPLHKSVEAVPLSEVAMGLKLL